MDQNVLTTEEAKKANIDELLKKLLRVRMVFLLQKLKNDFNNMVLMKFRRKKLIRF